MATDKDKRDANNQKLRSSRELANTAISLGFSVVIFVLIGVVINNVFNFAPWGILIGVFFALASMVYFFWQLIKASRQ